VRDLLPTPKKGDISLVYSESRSTDELLAMKFMPNLEDFGFTKAEINKKPDARSS
jgi:hypothetical protein